MDFTLHFCKDGVLRAKFSDNKPLIPVKFLQDNSAMKDSDFGFWCRWWESKVYFEEGLTVSKFLFCLEPWAEFWSTLTGKKVTEYIKEARKPCVVKNNKGSEEDAPLDWVGIFFYTEAEPNTEFSKDEDDLLDRDFNAWLNSPKEQRLTGDWNIYSAYKISGFRNGVEEQYSIDYTPMNELANTPIVLSDKQWFYINSWKMERILGKNQEHFFKDNAFGVCELNHGKMKFIVGEKQHSMREVVEGFFWWMMSNPASRESFVEQLMESKNELDLIHNLIQEDEKELNKKESNVINLFDKESSSEENETNDDENEKREIKVMPGAFDSLISGYEHDKEYWEEMLSEASQNDKVVLRIGQVDNAKSPENRLFGYIIKEDDKKANPIGTDYKEV